MPEGMTIRPLEAICEGSSYGLGIADLSCYVGTAKGDLHANRITPQEYQQLEDLLKRSREGHNTARDGEMGDAISNPPEGTEALRVDKNHGAIFEVKTEKTGDSQGEIGVPKQHFTAEQITSMGLPVSPEGSRPVAIIVDKEDNSTNKGIATVKLVSITEDGRVEAYELASPEWGGVQTHTGMQWCDDATTTGLPERSLEIRQGATGRFMQIGLDDPGPYSPYSQNSSMLVIRPERTESERKIARGDLVDGRFKRYSRTLVTGLGAAAFGLLSLASPGRHGVPDEELIGGVDYRPAAVEYDEIGGIEESGIEGFEEARNAYRQGDVEGLQRIVDASEFGQDHVETRIFEEIHKASSQEEIVDSANEALGDLGVHLSVPQSSQKESVSVLSPDQLEATREGALGVLDFANKLAPLVEGAEDFNVELVDVIRSNGGADSRAAGHYDPADVGNDAAIIRLAAGTIGETRGIDQARVRLGVVFAHELAHHLNLSTEAIIPDLSAINPRDVTYGGGELITGEEVVSDYASQQGGREDESETFESIYENEPLGLGEINLPVDHKKAAVIAALEGGHPGISALFMLADLEAAQKDSFVEERLEQAKDLILNHDSHSAVSLLLLAAAFAYDGRRKSRQQTADSVLASL